MSIVQNHITQLTGVPPLPVATCPLCHTVDVTMTPARLAAGAGWACTLCSQHWTQERLDVVARYREFVARRAAAGNASA
jgi:hypothetical protein